MRVDALILLCKSGFVLLFISSTDIFARRLQKITLSSLLREVGVEVWFQDGASCFWS